MESQEKSIYGALETRLSNSVGKIIIDEARRYLNDLSEIFLKAGNESARILVLSILKDIVDQETGQRGYLITGRDEFLDPFHRGGKNFKIHVQALRAMVANIYRKETVMADLEELRINMGLWKSQAADKEIKARREINETERSPLDLLQSTVSRQQGEEQFDTLLKSLTALQQGLWQLDLSDSALIAADLEYAILAQKSLITNFVITGDQAYIKQYSTQLVRYKKRYMDLSVSVLNAPQASRIQLITGLNGLGEAVDSWRQLSIVPQILARNKLQGRSVNTISQIQNVVRRATGKSILDEIRVLLDDIRGSFTRAQNFHGVNASLRVAKNLVDQETGQRGFLITGDESFLEPYHAGQKELLQSLAELRNIAADALDVDEMLAEIKLVEGLAAQWLRVAANPEISIRRQVNAKTAKYTDIEQVISAGLGKGVLDRIRFKLEQINRKFVKATNRPGQRLLVAIAYDIVDQETGQRGFLITGRDEFLQPFESGKKSLTKHFEELKALVRLGYDAAQMKQQIALLTAKSEQWIAEAGEPEIALRRSLNETGATMNDVTALIENETGKKLMDELRAKIDGFINEERRLIGVRTLKAERAAESTALITLLGTLLSIGVAMLTAVFVSRSIVGAVRRLSFATEKVAGGDFSEFVESPSCDEIGELADDFNDMIEQLRKSKEFEDISSTELHAQAERLSLQKSQIEQKNAELTSSQADLKLNAEELKRSSKYKSEFLANMSHELRTPLNSLLILSKHLMDNKKGNLDVSQVECAGIINEGGKDLLNIITDILDLSKVEAGMLSLHVEEVCIGQTLQRLEQQFAPIAGDKDVKLIFEDASGLDKMITDNQRLHQILKNFLSNAFKFTMRGEVIVTAFRPKDGFNYLRESLKGVPTVGFSVKDSGVGIPEEKINLIFESFQQADGSTSRQYGGTGLGLTISRELASFLGGEIKLTSTEGKGSTFTLLLPETLVLDEDDAQVSNQSQAQSHSLFPALSESPSDSNNMANQDAEAGRGEAILVIEDDPAFNKVLMDIVRETGFRCHTASNGETGLKLALAHEPSGILLDMGLPDMDGLEVLGKLKANPKTARIPVEIITARDVNIELLQSGAVGVIQKPAKEDEVVEALRSFSRATQSDINKILVVEDELVGQNALRIMLQESGLDVDCVSSGENAIKAASTGCYHCMILDLGLPDIDGLEVLERLRSSMPVPPPVVVYTGREINRNEQRQLEQYAISVIKKEDSFANLLGTVMTFLNSVESASHSQDTPSTTDAARASNASLGIQGQDSPSSGHDVQGSQIQSLDNQSVQEPSMQNQAALDQSVQHQSVPHGQSPDIELASGDSIALENRKVLLVDDDVRNLFSMSKILEGEGLEVVIAENGQVALDKLVATENDDIELIIMDIMMPVMDGYEAITEIRKINYLSELPIVAVTANAMPEDRQKCLDCGASDYMSKPVDTDALLSLLKLRLFKYAALPDKSASSLQSGQNKRN